MTTGAGSTTDGAVRPPRAEPVGEAERHPIEPPTPSQPPPVRETPDMKPRIPRGCLDR